MSDWTALFAVCVAIYLIDCVAWIERGTLACCLRFRRDRFWCVTGDDLPGNDRGGLVVCQPLSMSGSIVACKDAPVSMSPEGIASNDRYIPFDSIRSSAAGIDGVYVNSTLFAKITPFSAATVAADRIGRVRALPRGQRAQAIRDIVESTLDGAQVAADVATFHRAAGRVSTSSAALFVYLFGVAPAVIVLIGPDASWLPLLGGLVAITVATATMFFRAHRTLYPESTYERWVNTISMILVPIGAMRCVDTLSRDSLCRHHPLVVALTLCGLPCAAPFLRAGIIDLHTHAERPPGVAAAGYECAEWYRRAVVESLQPMIERMGRDVFAPPAREDGSALSYCPRCHGQFVSTGRECASCHGVQVVAFA